MTLRHVLQHCMSIAYSSEFGARWYCEQLYWVWVCSDEAQPSIACCRLVGACKQRSYFK